MQHHFITLSFIVIQSVFYQHQHHLKQSATVMLATGHITLSDGLLSASASSETIGHSKVSDRPHHTRQQSFVSISIV